MLKSIKQIAQESRVEDIILYSQDHITMTIICDDCMNGNHEIAGHILCECPCHNNSTCFVCGACIILDHEIKDIGAHLKCYETWLREQDDKMLYNDDSKFSREES